MMLLMLQESESENRHRAIRLNSVNFKMARKEQRHFQVLEEAFSQVFSIWWQSIRPHLDFNLFYPGGFQQRDFEGVDQGWDCVEPEQAPHAAPLPPPPLPLLLHLHDGLLLHLLLGDPAGQPAVSAACCRAVARARDQCAHWCRPLAGICFSFVKILFL